MTDRHPRRWENVLDVKAQSTADQLRSGEFGDDPLDQPVFVNFGMNGSRGPGPWR
jgi:hypothetical protein